MPAGRDRRRNNKSGLIESEATPTAGRRNQRSTTVSFALLISRGASTRRAGSPKTTSRFRFFRDLGGGGDNGGMGQIHQGSRTGEVDSGAAGPDCPLMNTPVSSKMKVFRSRCRVLEGRSGPPDKNSIIPFIKTWPLLFDNLPDGGAALSHFPPVFCSLRFAALTQLRWTLPGDVAYPFIL